MLHTPKKNLLRFVLRRCLPRRDGTQEFLLSSCMCPECTPSKASSLPAPRNPGCTDSCRWRQSQTQKRCELPSSIDVRSAQASIPSSKCGLLGRCRHQGSGDSECCLKPSSFLQRVRGQVECVNQRALERIWQDAILHIRRLVSGCVSMEGALPWAHDNEPPGPQVWHAEEDVAATWAPKEPAVQGVQAASPTASLYLPGRSGECLMVGRVSINNHEQTNTRECCANVKSSQVLPAGHVAQVPPSLPGEQSRN